MSPLLAVQDLTVDFATDRGKVAAVRGVTFDLQAGQSLAILGESGSGKSVTGRALLGLVDKPGRVRGTIEFNGEDIVGWDEDRLNTVRGPGISMVFQDSLDSLNPVFSVGSQLIELLRVRQGLDRSSARVRAVALMQQVGIPAAEERLGDYPHQFSGGMRQRICIALAIALRPQLLIADEPTTALDVTVQAGILRLIRALQRETQMALIFVTHDLSVARLVADEVAVMYAGKVVERGRIEDIYRRPAHPYTSALLASQPESVRRWSDLKPVAGAPPDKADIVPGCAFHPRCPLATDRCTTDEPELRALGNDRLSRCHYAEEVLDVAH
jgi:peptide/nickel transport system ATP-binding protein/oligopeptide transport system ATP-binding protein